MKNPLSSSVPLPNKNNCPSYQRNRACPLNIRETKALTRLLHCSRLYQGWSVQSCELSKSPSDLGLLLPHQQRQAHNQDDQNDDVDSRDRQNVLRISLDFSPPLGPRVHTARMTELLLSVFIQLPNHCLALPALTTRYFHFVRVQRNIVDPYYCITARKSPSCGPVRGWRSSRHEGVARV